MGDEGKQASAAALATAVKFDGESASALVRELRGRFREGTTRPYEWRVRQLQGIRKMIEEKEAEIARALNSDVGKPEIEAFVQEVAMAKVSLGLTIKQLRKWMKPEKAPTEVTTFPSSAEIVSEPLGVVLIISAWNYPFLLSIDPVIGAISAGNAVVLKPSEISPATSAFFAKYLPQYVDSSVIRVVEGGVAETSALLEQKWDKIFYTGSSKIARIVMTAAAKHLTPVVLELGGKCPVVFDSNVDLQVAVKRTVIGKWGSNNGQACIAPDYIITTKSFSPKLVEALKSILEKFYGKEPLESPDLSRIVNSNHFSRLSRLLDDKSVSDKIIYGGQRDEKSLKIAPTLLLDVPLDSLIMKEEIFGPLLPVITVENIEECFDLINSGEKPLAAYLFTRNKGLEEKFVRDVSAGGMAINETVLHMANNYLPFGGVGESGTGSYHGKYSFDGFSHKKAVLHRSFWGEFPSRYPPFTTKKQKILKAVLNGDILGAILAALGWR